MKYEQDEEVEKHTHTQTQVVSCRSYCPPKDRHHKYVRIHRLVIRQELSQNGTRSTVKQKQTLDLGKQCFALWRDEH